MNDIPLSTWANLAEIIGAGSIITGLIIGWFQIRQFRVQQHNAVAITLAQTFYNQDLAKAIALVQSIPDGVYFLRNYGAVGIQAHCATGSGVGSGGGHRVCNL
jgi:hypothetical protein